jgi:hypothetical protein
MTLKFKRKGMILSIIIACGIVLFIASSINRAKQSFIPVSVDFDSESCSVIFTISPGYKIHDVTIQEGYLSLPAIDENTTEIRVNALDVPVNRHDFLDFDINSTAKNHTDYYISFEILHQSDTQFIVQYFTKPTGQTDCYNYDYNES